MYWYDKEAEAREKYYRPMHKFSEIGRESYDYLPPDAIPLSDLYPTFDFAPLFDFWYSFDQDELYIRMTDHLYRRIIPKRQLILNMYKRDEYITPTPHRYILATRGYVPMTAIPHTRYLEVFPTDEEEYQDWSNFYTY